MQIPEALPMVTNLDRDKLMDRIRKLQTQTHRGVSRRNNTSIRKRVCSARPVAGRSRIMRQTRSVSSRNRIMKRNPKILPPMNNAYLNFLRNFRRTHTDLTPKQLVKQAARAWCRLSEEGKLRYRRQVRTEVSTVHPALMP